MGDVKLSDLKDDIKLSNILNDVFRTRYNLFGSDNQIVKVLF